MLEVKLNLSNLRNPIFDCDTKESDILLRTLLVTASSCGLVEDDGSVLSSCCSIADGFIGGKVFFVILCLMQAKTLNMINKHKMLSIVFIFSPIVIINFEIRFKFSVGHTALYAVKRKLKVSNKICRNSISPLFSVDILFLFNGSM